MHLRRKSDTVAFVVTGAAVSSGGWIFGSGLISGNRPAPARVAAAAAAALGNDDGRDSLPRLAAEYARTLLLRDMPWLKMGAVFAAGFAVYYVRIVVVAQGYALASWANPLHNSLYHTADRLERLLSIALSQTAAAVVDNGKKGEVKVTFQVERIPGTHQVRVGHVLKFTKPTSMGRSMEETDGATVLYVGKFGALSLAQPDLFDTGAQKKLID